MTLTVNKCLLLKQFSTVCSVSLYPRVRLEKDIKPLIQTYWCVPMVLWHLQTSAFKNKGLTKLNAQTQSA